MKIKKNNVLKSQDHTDKGLFHLQLGDLRNPAAVVMEYPSLKNNSLITNSPAYIHLSVTGKCYARCKGCVNAAITSSYSGERRDIVPISDTVPERDAACIVNLIKMENFDTVVICFYGGEPLLETKKITAICNLIKEADLNSTVHHMIYTNGDLLQNAVTSHPELLANIWLYSVSIDGRKEQHNQTRLGTDLDKIHSGLKKLKKIRTGNVLMWSTLREDQSLIDCFEEFMELFTLGYADHFFWHWAETSESFEQLVDYAIRYENDLTDIMDIYVQWLESGNILPIIHLNELVIYFLTGKKRNSSACGVEHVKNLDLIDGKIHSCADLPLEFAIGVIDDTGRPHIHKKDLAFLIDYKNDLGCYTCKVHDYCGGRCPVQAYSGGFERLRQYCQLMRLHVGCVKGYLDRIVAAMEKHAITVQDLYDTSAYFAQFTDVTP